MPRRRDKKAPEKSGEKSGEAQSSEKSGETRPGTFQAGYDPRRGRGPQAGAPNAGRPSDEWRKACAQALVDAKALDVVKAMISGDIYERIGTDGDGEPIYGETKNRDRLGAIEFVAGYAYGKPPQKLEVEDPREQQTVAQVAARMMELLPRVLPLLPVEKRHLVAWVERGKAAREVLVSGRVVKAKDAGEPQAP